MQIQVSGKSVDVGESLRTHIQQHLEGGINKYIDRINMANVVISKDAHRFQVDINANVGTHAGLTVKSNALGDDPYAVFEAALHKIEKQLRRYKRKITNHHKQDGAVSKVMATKYVLPANVAEEEAEHAALIIAEKSTEIETLSVSEAVMKMDLQHLPALMFYNASHGGLNVVYRREDGNISWVDPKEKQKKVA